MNRPSKDTGDLCKLHFDLLSSCAFPDCKTQIQKDDNVEYCAAHAYLQQPLYEVVAYNVEEWFNNAPSSHKFRDIPQRFQAKDHKDYGYIYVGQ